MSGSGAVRSTVYRDRAAWQVPVAVLVAALAVAALGPVPATVPAIYLAAVAPELTRVDLREHRLPNRMVIPGIVVGLAAAALSWLATGTPPLVPLAASLAFALLLFLLGLGGGIGMGDVKLAAVIGLASPTIAVATAAPVLAFLAGGVVATVVLIARGRGQRIAFGPFLLAGYVAALAVVLVLTVAVTRIGR